MVTRPIDMEKYIKIGGEKPIVDKKAPEKYKKLARETNDEYRRLSGEDYYIIEE